MPFVKIVDPKSHMWYKDKLNQVFYCRKKYDFLDYYVCRHGAIFTEDCKSVKLGLIDKILVLFGVNKIVA